MKKTLLFVCLLALLFGCSQRREWNHQQRQQMREMLRQYRDMVYLENLTDGDFIVFTDGVAADLEKRYPNYRAFVAMPAMNDTVTMVVITTIISDVKANPHNMRHMFPYEQLVANGTLPAGMDHHQQRKFYRCLAERVNTSDAAMYNFAMDCMKGITDTTILYGYMRNCLPEVVVTETTVVETVNK